MDALAAAVREPGGPAPERRVSHSAWVVLAADRAYKLKRPVRLPFLDFSTPERRRAACEAENSVNQALAAPLMLGVRGVRPSDGGVAVCDPDDRRAIDWLVLMRRFDEGRTMAALLAHGALTADHVRAAAARIAAFHAAAGPLADERPAARVRAIAQRNLEELRAAAGAGAALGEPGELLLHGVDIHAAKMRARARRGLVRDGHGDLRAEHVVLMPGGEVLIVDRLEFDPALRRIDVGDDLSFLTMDLEALGAPWAARLCVQAYREAGGDPGPADLLAAFGAHRALVRAKVALLRAGEPGAEGANAAAASFVALGARLAWRALGPLVVLVTGPPASGKSTLAAALAARSGLPVLGSDLVRKEILGLPADAPAPAGAYAPAQRTAVYTELGRRACAILAGGAGMIVDATFGAPGLGAAFLAQLAPSDRAGLLAIECRTPPDVRRARAARPREAGSDAGPHVAEALGRRFEPLGAGQVVAVDGSAPPARALAAVERALAARPVGMTPA